MQRKNEKISIRYTNTKYDNLKLLDSKELYDTAMEQAMHELKYRGIDVELELEEMLERIQGRMIYPSKVYLHGDKIEIIKSNLIMIDLDGFRGNIDELYERGLSNLSVGYIHSPSYIPSKPIRCRLIFIIDTAITNNDTYLYLREIVTESLSKLGLEPPVLDTSNANATDIIRIGHGYKVYNPEARIEFELFKDEVEEKVDEKRRKREEKLQRDQGRYYIYTCDELIDRANFIKKHKSLEIYDDWKRLILSLVDYYRSEFINEDELEDIAVALSTDSRKKVLYGKGGLLSLINTETLDITIGTFIWTSNKLGYRPTYEIVNNRVRVGKIENETEIENVEELELEDGKYITKDMAKEWLVDIRSRLIEAPPNSGKTTALMSAMKELAYKEKRPVIYIMSVPSIPLVDSLIDIDNKVVGYYGTMEDTGSIEEFAEREISRGIRIFVTTYDKTKDLMVQLYRITKFLAVEIIVDECHQLAQNYQFRNKAISGLLDISRHIKIGLSGTPEPVLTNSLFTIHTNIKKQKSAINAYLYNVYTYTNKDNEDALCATINAIKEPLLKREPVLLFVGKEKSIDFIINHVREVKGLESINISKIVSEKKNENQAYRDIVDKKEWPKGVDLIVSTNVISEGISIYSKYNSHIFLFASANMSPFFDKYLIRQSASRYRDNYYSFNLIIKAYETDEEVKLYDYQAGANTAIYYGSRMAENLNESFEDFSESQRDKVVLGDLAEYYGVSYDREADYFEFDEFYLRQKMVELQCRYYMSHRRALVNEIGNMLGKEINKVYDVTYQNKSEKKKLTIEELKTREEKQKVRSQKRDELENYLTHEAYEGYKRGDKHYIKKLEKSMNKEQFEAFRAIHLLVDYESCLKIVSKVTRAAEIHKFEKCLKVVEELNKRVINHKGNDTDEDTIIKEFAKIVGLSKENRRVHITKPQFDECVETTAHTVKFNVRQIKNMVNQYFSICSGKVEKDENGKSVNTKDISLWTTDSIAEYFGIEETIVKKALTIFSQSRKVGGE